MEGMPGEIEGLLNFRGMLATRNAWSGCRELDDLQSGAIRKGIVEAGEGEDSPADGDLVSSWSRQPKLLGQQPPRPPEVHCFVKVPTCFSLIQMVRKHVLAALKGSNMLLARSKEVF